MSIEIIKLGDIREREVAYRQGEIIRDTNRDIVFHEDTIVPVTECYKTDHINPKYRLWEITAYHFDRARPANPPPPPKGPSWFSSLWSWLFGDPQVPPARVVKE